MSICPWDDVTSYEIAEVYQDDAGYAWSETATFATFSNDQRSHGVTGLREIFAEMQAAFDKPTLIEDEEGVLSDYEVEA
jgi:hypothetical protein